MAHADDATKTLTKAVPTKNADGNVTKWNITMSYDKNDYVVEYSHEVSQTNEDGDEVFTLQAPTSFSQADLIGLCPTDHWDNVYNSQYESTHPAEEAPVETTDNEFDLSTLSS